jgi:hypothetical protein
MSNIDEPIRCINCDGIVLLGSKQEHRSNSLWGEQREVHEQLTVWLTSWFSSKLGLFEAQLCAIAMGNFLEEFRVHEYRSKMKIAYISGSEKEKLACEWRLVHLGEVLLF